MAIFPDDYIDTRKILERIEGIESDNKDSNGDLLPPERWAPGDRVEWLGLQEVISEVGEDASRDGVLLVNESSFEDHIRDEYLDIGPELHEFNPDTYRYDRLKLSDLYSRPPFNRIDWSEVAWDGRHDYSQLEVDGVTYYYIAE